MFVKKLPLAMQLKLETTQCYINYSHIVCAPLHGSLTVSSLQCILATDTLIPQTLYILYSIHSI